MTKFFRCGKCGYQFVAGSGMSRNNFTCGAVVEYVEADDPEVGGDKFLPSAGIKPLGCGGKIEEVT